MLPNHPVIPKGKLFIQHRQRDGRNRELYTTLSLSFSGAVENHRRHPPTSSPPHLPHPVPPSFLLRLHCELYHKKRAAKFIIRWPVAVHDTLALSPNTNRSSFFTIIRDLLDTVPHFFFAVISTPPPRRHKGNSLEAALFFLA